MIDSIQPGVKRYIQVTHEYTPKISLTEWGETEVRFNNRWELSASNEDADIRRFLDMFGDRIGNVTEPEWNHRFEGIYGYRWKNVRIEILTVKTTLDTTVVMD